MGRSAHSARLLSFVGGPVNFNTPFVGLAGTIPTVDLDGIVNLGTNDLNATTLTGYGTLTGTGTITVSGLTTLNAGTISGSCTVNADGGMTGFNISLKGCTLNNPIGQTVSGNLSLLNDVANGAVFNNYGTYTLSEPEQFYGSANSGAPPSFNNEGSFIVDADDPGTVDTVGFSGLPFNNEGGTVEVQAGTLRPRRRRFQHNRIVHHRFRGDPRSRRGLLRSFLHVWHRHDVSGAGQSSTFRITRAPGILAGTSTLTGPTTIGAGTLQVDGSQPSSAADVNPSDNDGINFFGFPILSGTGTVESITSVDGRSVAAMAPPSPVP